MSHDDWLYNMIDIYIYKLYLSILETPLSIDIFSLGTHITDIR